MNYLKLSIILLLLSGIRFCNGQPVSNHHRQVIGLNSSWAFHFAYDISTTAVKKTVNLPHTWNAEAVASGKLDYLRTSGIYEKKLFVPIVWKNKRLFLYFEGANSVAAVFVNHHFVTEHHGGYTAFCAEITGFVKPGANNDIMVQVSNASRLDVLPLTGDFNVYGGIHRPVSLLVTSKACISPLDHASPGVYLIQKKVSAQMAYVDVLTKLSTRQKGQFSAQTTVLDTNGNIVAHANSSFAMNGQRNIQQPVTIKVPHLWDGKADPYLYHVRVQLLQAGKVIDEVDQPLGLRYFKVTADKGFFLNGRHLDLHGVGLHEDVAGKGSALSHADENKDMQLIKEIGATALRLTHYPHQQYFYGLCDTTGLIVWSEIPMVGPGGYNGEGYIKSTALEQQARQVLVEMIRQNFNHPSVCFWGLFNELKLNYDNPVPFLKQLNKLAKKEDPGRLTTCATFLDNDVFNRVTDVIAWNKYYGWYGGTFSQLGTWADNTHQRYPQKPFAISEFGAGGSPFQHAEELKMPYAAGKFHPEEWQSFYHEQSWEQLRTRPFIWGKFVWSLADFGSSVRNEGTADGLNDKGLVTYDRRIKKDAFYFYKANWNPEPMLYIAGRRNKERTKASVQVKVYTNAPKAELFVNGRSIGSQSPDAVHIIRWDNVKLEPGKNQITVKAGIAGKTLEDKCEWELAPTEK